MKDKNFKLSLIGLIRLNLSRFDGYYKSKILKSLALALALIWEMPQNLLGFIFYLFLRKKIVGVYLIRNRYNFIVPDFSGGISLGIFTYSSTTWLVPHEYGHTRQSKVLGPLLLLLIGLPSLIWATTYVLGWNASDYDSFFIEGMATKLGNKVDNDFVEVVLFTTANLRNI